MPQTLLALLDDRLRTAARLTFGDDVPLPSLMALPSRDARHGHRVLRVNHLGDWGAQFGMLLAHLEDVRAGGDLAIADVEAFYREANQRDQADPDFHERARRRVVELQSGDPAALAAWRELVD